VTEIYYLASSESAFRLLQDRSINHWKKFEYTNRLTEEWRHEYYL